MQINFATGKMYKGQNNENLMYAQLMCGYKENRWLTFVQAKELGRKVIKGSKGFKIIKVIDDPKKDSIGIRHYTVFNLEQTEVVN